MEEEVLNLLLLGSFEPFKAIVQCFRITTLKQVRVKMLVWHNAVLHHASLLDYSLPEHIGTYSPQAAGETETLPDKHVLFEVSVDG